MDPLSVASGSFAAVGLADVVIRLGKELYGFLTAIKAAPNEINGLEGDLRNLECLVTEVKFYWEECSTSPLIVNHQQILPLFASSLQGLQQELLLLIDSVKSRGGKTRKWVGGLKWVLGAPQLEKSLRRLDSHKAALSLALILTGRRNDLNLQKDIKCVQTALEETSQVATNRGVLQFQQELDKLASAITEQNETYRGRPEGINPANLSGRAPFELSTSGIRSKALPARRRTSAANVSATRRYKEMRKDITTNGVDTTRAFNALQSDIKVLTAKVANFGMAETASGSGINLRGPSKEALLLPLLLLQPKLYEAITQLLYRNQHEISILELDWLKLGFDDLLDSIMQNVVTQSWRPTPSAFDASICSPQTCSRSDPKLSFHGPIFSSVAEPAALRSDNQNEGHLNAGSAAKARPRPRRLRRPKHRTWCFELPIGKLDVHTVVYPFSSTTSRRRVGFCFIPRSEICPTALNAWFTERLSPGQAPRLSAQLNAYVVTGIDDGLDELCRHGTIEDIDTAFRTGKASPFALNACGMSIHNSAAYYGRRDVLVYLIDQGLGPASSDGGSQAFSGLSEYLQGCAYHNSASLEPSRMMFGFLLDHGCDINAGSGSIGLLLHSTVYDASAPHAGTSISQLDLWTWMLKSEGYDLERRDVFGATALLSHAVSVRTLSSDNCCMLLDEGADPKAQDSDDSNALHKVMHSIDNGELFLENIYRKLHVLVAASCNVNQCDIWGQTPSDDALSFGCWDEWCSALITCGYDVHDVLKADRIRKEEFVDRIERSTIEVLEGIYKHSSTSWEALQLYLDVTKESIERYIHIKQSATQPNTPWSQNLALVEFLESDTLELCPGQGTYEQVHKELLDSHDRGLDLVNTLAPFSRVVPGEKRFTTTIFRLLKWDTYDDAISTLNRMKKAYQQSLTEAT